VRYPCTSTLVRAPKPVECIDSSMSDERMSEGAEGAWAVVVWLCVSRVLEAAQFLVLFKGRQSVRSLPPLNSMQHHTCEDKLEPNSIMHTVNYMHYTAKPYAYHLALAYPDP